MAGRANDAAVVTDEVQASRTGPARCVALDDDRTAAVASGDASNSIAVAAEADWHCSSADRVRAATTSEAAGVIVERAAMPRSSTNRVMVRQAAQVRCSTREHKPPTAAEAVTRALNAHAAVRVSAPRVESVVAEIGCDAALECATSAVKTCAILCATAVVAVVVHVQERARERRTNVDGLTSRAFPLAAAAAVAVAVAVHHSTYGIAVDGARCVPIGRVAHFANESAIVPRSTGARRSHERPPRPRTRQNANQHTAARTRPRTEARQLRLEFHSAARTAHKNARRAMLAVAIVVGIRSDSAARIVDAAAAATATAPLAGAQLRDVQQRPRRGQFRLATRSTSCRLVCRCRRRQAASIVGVLVTWISC